MKIIKNGVLPEYVKRFMCENCGCVFEAGKHEYYGVSQIEFMEKLPNYKCKCPTCSDWVYTD